MYWYFTCKSFSFENDLNIYFGKYIKKKMVTHIKRLSEGHNTAWKRREVGLFS